jgi:hypothetical protein
VWLDEDDFDNAMDEVRCRAGGGVFADGCGIDVDVVLLRVYGISPDYCDTEPGVLGRTRFFPDGRMTVQISRALANGAELDATLRRRLRSTTAHECAHIALHGHLHAVPATGALFPDMRPVESRTLCRTETIEQPGRVQRAEWWEYQGTARWLRCYCRGAWRENTSPRRSRG